MHFGLHLVRKGIIEASHFVAALEQQLQDMVPIGQMAIDEGVLTMRQVFEVLRAQSDVPPERFGDAAVERGVLTQGDLAQLLMKQSDRKRPFSEILVEQGVLTEEQAAEELSAFRRARERGGRWTPSEPAQRAGNSAAATDAAMAAL